MKQLLITGFDPFGGEAINPSWEAVKLLDDTIGQYRLTKLQLPTVFGKAAQQLLTVASSLSPDAILSVGQAGGRAGITPEVIGINLREARIADNEGNQPVNEPIIPSGPAACFSTLPVREMSAAIQAGNLPGSLSYSAGTFVCNDLLYTVLHHYEGTSTQAGFIHVPFLPQQAKDGQPSLALDDIVRGLTLAIQSM
ncbi:MAG: pyroglutamyl-peptidase I [Clostridiales bacterium]|nr:pyroglutamyl-peptidase I [Clostridiales bacterium]